MKRASYREGVRWIAVNDDPETMDAAAISGYVSVALLADIFGKEQEHVALDVVAARLEQAALAQGMSPEEAKRSVRMARKGPWLH